MLDALSDDFDALEVSVDVDVDVDVAVAVDELESPFGDAAPVDEVVVVEVDLPRLSVL